MTTDAIPAAALRLRKDGRLSVFSEERDFAVKRQALQAIARIWRIPVEFFLALSAEQRAVLVSDPPRGVSSRVRLVVQDDEVAAIESA